MSILRLMKFLLDLINSFFTQSVEPSLPKKNFLKLLSIPITEYFFFAKKFTDSEPTRPLEPVIKTIEML